MINKFSKIFAFFALISLSALLLTSCGSPKKSENLLKVVKTRGAIIAGVKYDSRPFGFMDKDQKLKGYDIDLIREISKRVLGSPNAVNFKQVTSSNRIFSLTSGAVDMVAATMTITPTRSQIIDFSDPYFEAGQAIMIPRGSKIKVASDLNNKRVLVVLGSTSEKNLRLMAPKANVLGFRTYTDAFSALRSGRGDALTTDDAILYGFAAEDNNFVVLGQRYSREPYGIGFKKDPMTKDFQIAVNDAIKEIILDGTMGRLKKKWILQYQTTNKSK